MKAAILIAAMALACLEPMGHAKTVPNLELKDLSGKPRKISELRGSVAVINFWATWCAPCREELPLLSKLNQEYAAKGVRFIAASADELKNRPTLERYVSANQVKLEVWIGADLDMLERTGLGNELPATLIVDDRGQVVARILGEAREEDIRRPLDWLLEGEKGAAPKAVVKHY